MGVTPPRHTGPVPAPAIDPALSERRFVAEVVAGLATLRGDDGIYEAVYGDLSIPLGLSAWIFRAAMKLPDAYDALLDLRARLLEVSGLDRASEPVPLRVGDQRAALRSLGAYLYDLVGRAARRADLSPVELAERVLEQLGAD